MKMMLRDDNISHEDRKRLSNYYQRKLGASQVSVAYAYGKGCEDAKLGRLFPLKGVGLQSFPRHMRDPLLKKYYWDLDVENCHYRIALSVARELGLKHTAIEQYVMNRDDCLKSISDEREVGKTQFLRTLYGGDISLYDPLIKDVPCTVKPEGVAFLRQLQNEIATLMENIWMRNTQYHKLKTGAEGKAMEKKHNSKASLMSLLFQTAEKKILDKIDETLTANGRIMGVLIHDGGCVEKLDGEIDFPDDIRLKCEEALLKDIGYELPLKVKPMTFAYTPKALKGVTYADMKIKFEKSNFLIGSLVHAIHADGKHETLKYSDARIKFANWKYEDIDSEGRKVLQSFLGRWLEDPTRLDYDRVEFEPNVEICPKRVYNLFEGFEAEKLRPAYTDTEGNPTLTEEDIAELVKPIIYHIQTLTKGYEDYVLRWLANLIQAPHIKSDVTIFIRDMGGLLVEGGGTGKNLLLDWIGNRIIGEKYYLVVGDNSTLYGSFNSKFEGKLLVMVEEASGKDNHANADKLKSTITTKRKTINKKNIAEYEVNDYARWLFSSNNQNPLPIRNGSRREGVFDTDPKHRNDKVYFDALVKAMSDPKVQFAFYHYLKTRPTWTTPIEFQTNRPITEAYVDVRRINAQPHYKWLVHELKRGTLPAEGLASEYYRRFKEWCSSLAGEKPLDRMMSQTMFGKLIKDGCVDEATHGVNGTTYRIDFKRLISGFIDLHLLMEGEAQVEETGELKVCLVE